MVNSIHDTPPEAATAWGMGSQAPASCFRVLEPHPADLYLLALLLLFLHEACPLSELLLVKSYPGDAESSKCPRAAVPRVSCPVVTTGDCLPYFNPLGKLSAA